MIAMRIGEPAKFLVVQRDGRDVLLVAAMGTETDVEVPCCLTIWEVVPDDADGLDLELVADTQRSAVEVAAVDFEGDGTDELLVTEGQFSTPEDEEADASLLRWASDRFARTAFVMTGSGCCPSMLDVADTDGLPGEEVLLFGFVDGVGSSLHRLTVDGTTVTLETAPRAQLGEMTDARALTLASGPAIVTADVSSQALTVWSWPTGGRLQEIAHRTTGGQIAAILGTGDETRIVIAADPTSGSILVVPGDLGGGAGPTATVSRDRRASSFGGAIPNLGDSVPPTPFFGVLPDGLPGSPDVFVFGGTRVAPDADPEALVTAAPMALLPDRVPMARVGPDGGWSAVSSQTPDIFAFGFGRADAAEDLLAATPAGALHLTSAATLTEVEADLGRLSPTLIGVAPDPEHPPILLVGNEAVDVEIEAPPGTTVTWEIRSVRDTATVTPDGVARIRLMEPAGPDAPDGSGANVGIRVVTPGGHAYWGLWRINVYRQPPDLGIRDEPSLVDFDPTLTGQTLPGSTLTINGVEQEIAADGSFAIPVEVGIVPTDLHVVVTDAVGNRTERVVSRVWPLDYRQLPFVPIAVLLTVVGRGIPVPPQARRATRARPARRRSHVRGDRRLTSGHAPGAPAPRARLRPGSLRRDRDSAPGPPSGRSGGAIPATSPT